MAMISNNTTDTNNNQIYFTLSTCFKQKFDSLIICPTNVFDVFDNVFRRTNLFLKQVHS